MFPKNVSAGDKESNNAAIALLGNRMISDQTLMEYLIEFLLVFVSAKDLDGSGKLQFHSRKQIDEGTLPYYVNLNVALRRFIFYDRSKQDSRSKIDTSATQTMKELLNQAVDDREDIDLVHDLLLSYAAVTRNRGWYAQALMPVSPNLILTDLQGIKARQKIKDFDINDSKLVDRTFAFDKHNFLARGGQILYLHLLQPMADDPELESHYRAPLEAGLRNMLANSGNGVDLLAEFVQQKWECRKDSFNNEQAYALKSFNMGFIQDAYGIRSRRFLEEVTMFLRNDIHPITRIELLSQGMILALVRVMHIVSSQRINPDDAEPIWILDMSGLGGISNIAKLSAVSCEAALNSFQTALTKICEDQGMTQEERFAELQARKKDTGDVFKRLAKEIKLIIPPKGDHERFSLSETLVRYLVLALVPPQTKITLDSFLDRLYEHFRMVIGSVQYRQSLPLLSEKGMKDMSDYFTSNQNEFQSFLKSCGFLRDLSDATAIVENPYREVKLV